MKTVEEMKEFKGTKGKWVLWNDGYAFDVVKESDAIMTIACVYDGKEAENDINVVVAKANAQLIAAAPELLKELIDFCKTFESTIGYQGYDHNVFVALNDRYIKSKKAINKALGL